MSIATKQLRFLGWGVSNWQAAFEWIAAGLQEAQPGLDVRVLGRTGPRMEALAAGEVDAAITTPTADAAMARAGTGPHPKPLPNLRAIAALPHRDRLVLSLREEIAERFGLRTMRDMVEKQPPLRLAAPERDGDSPNFAVEQLLALHGASWQDLEAWGGGWLEMSAPMPGPDALAQGEVDGIFNEAYMLLYTLPPGMRLRILEPSPEALRTLATRFGHKSALVEAGEFPGVEHPTRAVDFSDWVIMVRDDMPDDPARAMARIVVEDRARFEARYTKTPVHLSAVYYPLQPERMCRTGEVPLHSAAEAYYRETGLLP